MSDLHLFLLGLFVTLMVSGAVGLLMWGAANEPRGNLLPRRKTKKADQPTGSPQLKAVRVPSRSARRLVG